MRTLTGLDELHQAAGEELGRSAWHTVSQADVDAFAAATGGQPWIHVDVERAAASPFGGTIVPGYLTLALAPQLAGQIFELHGFAFAVNHGLDRVRFPAALPVGDRVRLQAKLLGVEEIPGGAELTTELTFEHEGGERPVCVAVTVARVYAIDDDA
jgi:acyl dehydratase